MAVKPFSKEQLNFFKFSSIVLVQFPKDLRQIFVTMWNSKIAVLPGYQIWDDSTAVRNMFVKSEGGKTNIPTNQSINEWDCTALFKATIYAKTFGSTGCGGPIKNLNDLYIKKKKPVPGSFHPSVNSPAGNQDETLALVIDQLRLLRNTLCHSAKSELSKSDFDQFVQLAKDALTAVNVSTTTVDAIGGMTEDDFPTEKVNELNECRQKELQAHNQFLQDYVIDTLNGIGEMTCEMRECMKTRSEEKDKTLDSLPNSHLPPLVPRFTGRKSECEELSSLLTSTSTRLVNLWGSPGFGKTSTAIAVAHHLHSLTHPVYYSTFRGKSSKDEFISILLSMFSSFSKPNANQTSADKLCSIFKEIRCPFFLVLDNLDDLLACKSDDSTTTSIKDEIVNLVKEILDRCPNVSLLTTARESLEFMRLNVAGYEAIRMRPLDQFSSNELILKFFPSATKDVLLDVAKISGNVPLAIKLTCSLILENTDTPKQILYDLKSSGNLLEILDNPDYPNDLRLEKLIDSSFDRLSKDEKQAFVSLSVFLGTDINSDAAVAVIGGDKRKARRTSSILVRKSLIDQDPESKMYSMHPLLQSFAIKMGENELKEVSLSSRTRFNAYYLILFQNLNEQFLTGSSLKACVNFFKERQNIYESFLQSLSKEGLCENLFEVLTKAEFFLITLYVNELAKVESLYNLAMKNAKEQKNDLAYTKLVVSKCFMATVEINYHRFLPENIQIRKIISSLADGFEAKCLCYEGILHVVTNGISKSGVQLLEQGCCDLTNSCDQQILKCLILQLVAAYYNFSKKYQKSRQFFKLALDQCKELGDSKLFLIGECETDTENIEEESAFQNHPLILGFACVLSIWAREFLSDEIKDKIYNNVLEMQNQLLHESHIPGNGLGLLQIGDLALVFLGTDQATQMEATIQAIKIDLEKEKRSSKQTSKGDVVLEKTERQKLLEQRLALCYFRKAWRHTTKDEQDLALEAFQRALDVRLELNGEHHESTAQVYNEIGIAQTSMKDYASAQESHGRALKIRLKLHGKQHESTADSYFRLSATKNKMGDYVSALQSHNHALDIRLKLCGEQHAATADSYSAIGSVQNNMRDFISALQSRKRALDIRLKLYGEQHAATARSYSAIGSVQNNMRDFISALQSHGRALNIRLKLHGDQHASTADSYSLIGITENDMGDHLSALQSHQRALKIRLNLFGEQHQTTAKNYRDISITQHRLKDHISALKSLQHVLDITLSLHGENHESTADIYKDIASVQNDMGDHTQALESHRRALNIILELHGEQHETMAHSYFQIAAMENNVGEHSSALNSHQRALGIRLNLPGEQDDAISDSYSAIGNVQNSMGHYTSSLKSHQCALEMRTNLHGEAHSSTVESYYSIGLVHYNMRDYTSSLVLLHRALNIILNLPTEHNAKVADIYHLIGMAETKMEDYTPALESHHRELDIRLKQHGEQHETTAHSYFQIGTTQYSMGDYTSALESHQRALNIRLKLYSKPHETTAESYLQIGITQNIMGDYTAALHSNSQALEISWNVHGELHSMTANCYRYVAIALRNMGKRDLAMKNFDLARDINSKICKT